MHKWMNKMNRQNVAIFVDYDNVYIALNQYYRDFTRPLLPYTVIQKIRERYEKDNIILFNLYADLQNIKIGHTGFNILNDCNISLQHIAKGKNSSDIVLLLDALKAMQQYSFLDKVVIVSSDSDMRPICKEGKLHNTQIEVLYVETVTNQDYIHTLSQNSASIFSIEQLLNIPVANVNCTVKELFGQITSDKDYLIRLLIQINEIIRDVYEKYLREDKYGNIISAGAVSLSALSYHIKDRHLVPEYISAKYEDHSVFVQMLAECGIIESLVYQNKYQEFTTWILSSEFLQQHNCSLPNLISPNSFKPA